MLFQGKVRHFSVSYMDNNIKKKLSIYLGGEILRGWEGEGDFFDSSDDLLQLGYDRVGSMSDHSLLEKYYPVRENKGVTFKVYFYKGVPWSSGVDFFGFRLGATLKSVKQYIGKIEIFFDMSDCDNGALVINDFCVCRFSFLGEKSPRILTFETDVCVGSDMQDSRIATTSVFRQFSHIADSYGDNEKIRRIFEIAGKVVVNKS